MDNLVTWLHLSDLHAGERPGWNAPRVTETLTADLRRLRAEHGSYPDLLFFTGDAVLTAKDEEFDIAGRFFENVRDFCGIERENVFLVPGNHDVDRSQMSLEDAAWLEERRVNGDVEPVDEMLRRGDSNERWRRIAVGLSGYRDFLERMGYGHLLLEHRSTYVCRRRIRGVQIAVIGLDSAWSCRGDDAEDERGRLWLEEHYRLADLAPKLEGADLRVGLVHHPPSWLFDTGSRLRREFERLFDVLLHGHRQKAWIMKRAGGHLRLAAGACYGRPRRESGYNHVRLDFENDKGEVSLRRYDRLSGDWQRCEIPGETDAQGVWHVDLQRIAQRQEVGAPVLSSEILVSEVFGALRRNPLVVLLAQDGHSDGAVLRGIRERARRDGHGEVLHVTPPRGQATKEQYFARLGRQCGFAEEIRGPGDWEDAIYRRLDDGEALFVLVSHFDKGSEEGRERLGAILRALSETFGESLRVVFSGGERLAALKYEKGDEHSVLSSAERRDWPEPTVGDVLTWSRAYPGLKLERRDAADVRTLCGAHPRWIQYCLEQRQRGMDERRALLRYDAIDQVFTPYRRQVEARERICEWLGRRELGEWEAWIGDGLLRRLYWKNVLREEDGRIVWRSGVAREVGKRVLDCG